MHGTTQWQTVQQASYDTPRVIFWNAAKASSLGPKCTVPTSNAFEISSGCWPRTRRPGSGHGLNFQVSDGPVLQAMLPSAPSASGKHGASKVLSGTGSNGLPPVLRPRLASGLLRVPFRLVLGEGCGFLPARRDSSNVRAWIRASFLQLTLEIRVLHVRLPSSQPFNPFAQLGAASRLNMHCRKPLPQGLSSLR